MIVQYYMVSTRMVIKIPDFFQTFPFFLPLAWYECSIVWYQYLIWMYNKVILMFNRATSISDSVIPMFNIIIINVQKNDINVQ